MCNAALTHDLFTADSAAATTVRTAPTLIENVSGYTLAANKLLTFSAMVFDAGKVVATGDAKDLRRRFPAAQIIDGNGRCLLPGLIDAHGHVFELGFATARIQLWDTQSLAEAQQRIRGYAAANPNRNWLQGSGWNQVKWQLGRFPSASELDAAVADKPVVLSRVDGHAKWLNTKAMQAAGITRDTPDPPGGRIERDAAGNPSGVLVDKAMALVDRVVPEPTDDDRRTALKAAMAQMNSVGLTGVGDAGDDASEIAMYRQLGDQQQLSVRAYVMIRDVGPDFMSLSRNGPLVGYADDHLTMIACGLVPQAPSLFFESNSGRSGLPKFLSFATRQVVERVTLTGRGWSADRQCIGPSAVAPRSTRQRGRSHHLALLKKRPRSAGRLNAL